MPLFSDLLEFSKILSEILSSFTPTFTARGESKKFPVNSVGENRFRKNNNGNNRQRTEQIRTSLMVEDSFIVLNLPGNNASGKKIRHALA